MSLLARIIMSQGSNSTKIVVRVDTRGLSSGGVVCYYYHKPGHVIQDCKKLHNRNQRVQTAHMASTNETSDQSIQISAKGFAKFQLYQESLKPSFTPITAIAESSKPKTCLVSSSSKIGH